MMMQDLKAALFEAIDKDGDGYLKEARLSEALVVREVP